MWNVWQVGSGSSNTGRDYSDIFLIWQVICVGPGAQGEYSPERYTHSHLKSFCRTANPGDVVLLRRGTQKVCAVGIIADTPYQWSEAFADIDGWDLQHVRRVHWFVVEKDFKRNVFGKIPSPFAKVNQADVQRWVKSIQPELSTPATRTLIPPLPRAGIPLKRSHLERCLFVEGLPSKYVDTLMETISSLERIAAWYSSEIKNPEGRPSEHETVAYLVVPLLFALGWSQQTAAIEWNNIDVALFEAMPSDDANLRCVVEAKVPGRAVFSALKQAKGYACQPRREGCHLIILTDGVRYAVYERDAWQLAVRCKFPIPTAYLNLLDMRESYHVYSCKGGIDALLLMARV